MELERVTEETGDFARNTAISQSAQGTLKAASDLERRSWKARATDAPQAVSLAQQALFLLQALPHDAVSVEQTLLEAKTYFSLGSAQERLSDYAGAFASGEEILRLANQAREKAGVNGSEHDHAQADSMCMNAYGLLGNVCDRRGDYADALKFRQADHDLAFAVGKPHNQAHALLRLGSTYFRLGDYLSALNLYLQARALFEQLTDPAGLGSVWNDIGNVYFGEHQYDDSLKAYQTGLAQFEHKPDPYWQAGLLSNIAGVYLKQEKIAEARAVLEQSLQLREAVGDRHGQGYSLTSLVEILHREGNHDDARAVGERALALFVQIGDQTGQALVRIALASVAIDDKQWDAAECHLNDALRYTEAQKMRETTYQIHEQLSRLFEKKGDAGRALAHYKEFHAVKQDLVGETTRHKLRNLEVLHRVAQARHDAELLKEHNEKLSAANTQQAELLAQLKKQAATLKTLSHTDALTGVLNRRSLTERLWSAYASAQRRRAPLTIALIDLDHFKRINDRFSHQVGDRVLQTVGQLLGKNRRETDIVARYGGEEFVLILPDTSLDDAERFCDALRHTISAYPWHKLHPDLRVTLSLGLCTNEGATSPEQMLSQADARMYEAKAAGRNRVLA